MESPRRHREIQKEVDKLFDLAEKAYRSGDSESGDYLMDKASAIFLADAVELLREDEKEHGWTYPPGTFVILSQLPTIH